MRLLIMGAPGAGKGTQAHSIAARYSIPAISTGSIFRESVAKGTPLGKRISSLMASGAFVPDEVTEEVVAQRLSEEDAANGWLLDGYPRTLHQVGALDEYLAANDQQLNGVIYLEVPLQLLTNRLVRRGQLEGRADDTAETIAKRMEVFVEETAPILDAYDARGLLVHVDGDGRIEAVSQRIAEALDEIEGR